MYVCMYVFMYKPTPFSDDIEHVVTIYSKCSVALTF